MSNEDRIKNLVIDTLILTKPEADAFNPDTKFDDLAVDGGMMYDLVCVVEEEFSITISEYGNIKTLRDLIGVVELKCVDKFSNK